MTPLIRRGLTAEASARPGESLDISAHARPAARRRLIAFAAIGIAAYAAALVATVPAGTIFPNRPWRTGVAGTVWNGAVGVGGTNRLAWHWAPLRSLAGLGFAADWTVTGAETALDGRALARSGRTVLDAVSGSADASLLQALAPTLPFTCDLTVQADFPRIVVGGSDQSVAGQLTTDAGTCRPKGAGGPTTSLPPLMLSAEHIGAESRLRLFPATQRRRTLMTITLGEDGSTEIGMTPEGAAALPFVGLPGGGSIKVGS